MRFSANVPALCSLGLPERFIESFATFAVSDAGIAKNENVAGAAPLATPVMRRSPKIENRFMNSMYAVTSYFPSTENASNALPELMYTTPLTTVAPP